MQITTFSIREKVPTVDGSSPVRVLFLMLGETSNKDQFNKLLNEEFSGVEDLDLRTLKIHDNVHLPHVSTQKPDILELRYVNEEFIWK